MMALATSVFGVVFIVLLTGSVSFGFWLYVRAVSEFPGDPLAPARSWPALVVSIFDAIILACLPAFIIGLQGTPSGYASSLSDFLVGYAAGRLIVPAILPPGPVTPKLGSWTRIFEGLRDITFDKVVVHVPVALLVVILPGVLTWAFGNGTRIGDQLVFLSNLLPPPLPAGITKLNLSAWFYVMFAVSLTAIRFQVALRPLKAILASLAGILAIVRLDLAYGTRLEIADGWIPDVRDLSLLFIGMFIASIVRALSREGRLQRNPASRS